MSLDDDLLVVEVEVAVEDVRLDAAPCPSNVAAGADRHRGGQDAVRVLATSRWRSQLACRTRRSHLAYTLVCSYRGRRFTAEARRRKPSTAAARVGTTVPRTRCGRPSTRAACTIDVARLQEPRAPAFNVDDHRRRSGVGSLVLGAAVGQARA